MEPTPPILATLEALYDEHAGDLFRWMLGMLGRREEAEDAIQVVYLKLARKADGLAEVRDLPAYLWTAARHHVRSVLRRRALERLWTTALDEIAAELLPAAKNPVVPADELRDVERAVGRLTSRLRAVVLLVGFDGCTIDEADRHDDGGRPLPVDEQGRVDPLAKGDYVWRIAGR